MGTQNPRNLRPPIEQALIPFQYGTGTANEGFLINLLRKEEYSRSSSYRLHATVDLGLCPIWALTLLANTVYVPVPRARGYLKQRRECF